MNPIQLLPLSLLLVALPAQGTTISITAATPIAAMTQVAGGAATFLGIAQGTPISNTPSNVFLNTSQSPSGGWLSATTICYPTMAYQQGIGVNFFERANARGAVGDTSGSSASTSPTGASFGPHAILCTFTNAPGTIGKIRLQFRASPAATGTTGVVLDIGNDGVIDLQSAVGVYQDFPFTFPASGQVTVRLGNECLAAGDGTSTNFYSWTEVWLGFMPDLSATSTFTSYGQGCGPVAQAGEVVLGTNRVITMLVSGCYPSMPVIAVGGTQPINLPLLGGCSLLCNALDFSLLTADGNGVVTDSWTIPVTLVGRTYHQFLPITLQNNNLVISASNGVRIDCVR